jgi:hypothetical protein
MHCKDLTSQTLLEKRTVIGRLRFFHKFWSERWQSSKLQSFFLLHSSTLFLVTMFNIYFKVWTFWEVVILTINNRFENKKFCEQKDVRKILFTNIWIATFALIFVHQNSTNLKCECKLDVRKSFVNSFAQIVGEIGTWTDLFEISKPKIYI